MDDIWEVLERREVIAVDEHDLRKSALFLETRDTMEERFLPVDIDAIHATFGALLDPDELASLRITSERNPAAILDYLALSELCGDALEKGERAWVSVILDGLEPDPVRAEGSPDLFTPIDAQKLPFVEQFFRKAIVYIWREDCDPCDVVRGDFDEIFEEPPTEMALFSAFGPDASELLQEEYDVVGGPTTLFLFDGRVDTRHIGAPHREALETEIEKLRGF